MSALVVGVTGHRPDRLADADPELLRDRVREMLALVNGLLPKNDPPVLLTGLAEGADRIAAREAITLGFRVEAVLPFPRTDYERDFPHAASLAEFRELLAQSGAVRELSGSRETAHTQDAAYLAVGRSLLERSDVVLAVWDGRRGRGLGGTTQVLLEALQRGTPVVWISAASPHDASLLIGNAEAPLPGAEHTLKAALENRRAALQKG